MVESPGRGTPLAAQVLCGINAIYTVRSLGEAARPTSDRLLRCRIKGKVLRSRSRSYNPLAPGDLVEVLPDPLTATEGLIVRLRDRRTALERWNKKGRAPQVIAANADLAVCVSSTRNPPFRPRFIDRLAAAAEDGGLEVSILMNKSDLGLEEDARERLDDFARIGYPVLLCSALTGEGMGKLRARLQGKLAVFVGQSGVGKSSVLNTLSPGLGLRIGELSSKHDRGSHTTNYSSLVETADGLRVIDTPGIRELELAGIEPEDLAFKFREFAPLVGSCGISACLHEAEIDCAIRAAAGNGEIHPDRYETYLRVLAEIRESRSTAYG